MPKTLPIASPAPHRRSGTGALAIFALVYVAVLGILFTPDGYFTTADTTAPAETVE